MGTRLIAYLVALKTGTSGQVTTEYVLATGLFMVIFVWFHTVVQEALKKLFANAAFIILNAWR